MILFTPTVTPKTDANGSPFARLFSFCPKNATFLFPHSFSLSAKITEVAATAKDARIATHSHIKGLGLNDDGTADGSANAAGFVGQEAAREVAIHDNIDRVSRCVNQLLTLLHLSRCIFARLGVVLAGRGNHSRPHPRKENGRARRFNSRCTRYRQDCTGVGDIAGVGKQSTFLSDGRERGLFCGSQKDGGTDGEF